MAQMNNANEEAKLPAEMLTPEAFSAPLVSASVPFKDVLSHIQKIYDIEKQNFMSSNLGDPELSVKSRKWAKASRQLIEGAASLFLRARSSIEDREKALDILNTCKKDSSIRENNLFMQLEHTMQAEPNNKVKIDNLIEVVLEHQHFYCRAERTQQSYLNRFINAADYMTPELRKEKEISARVASYRPRIPKGHHFLPARPYPPMRIPEGEQVPYPPEPYLAWKSIPKSDFIYDEDHDEFVLPKGYVNEEKRIDDQSVVWDWENRTVTMKFIDGEPVTWPFWKPKDTADMLKADDWCAQYLMRVYKRYLADIEPPGLRPGDD